MSTAFSSRHLQEVFSFLGGTIKRRAGVVDVGEIERLTKAATIYLSTHWDLALVGPIVEVQHRVTGEAVVFDLPKGYEEHLTTKEEQLCYNLLRALHYCRSLVVLGSPYGAQETIPLFFDRLTTAVETYTDENGQLRNLSTDSVIL